MNTNTELESRIATVRKIENHMAAKAIKRKDVIEALGIRYQTFERRMKGEVPFTVEEIWTIARVLRARPTDILPDDAESVLGVAA